MIRQTIADRIQEILDEEGEVAERNLVDKVVTRLSEDFEQQASSLRREVRSVLHDLVHSGLYDRADDPNGGIILCAVRTASQVVSAIQRAYDSIVHRAIARGLDGDALQAGLICAVIHNRTDFVRQFLAAGASATRLEAVLGKTPRMFVGPRTDPVLIQALEEARIGEMRTAARDAPN